MKLKKIISTVIAAAMIAANLAAFSTVSFAATEQTVIIDDNFNSVSLSDKSGMNSAWHNIMGWHNTAPSQRAEGDICWKWEGTGKDAGAWEQIYLNMDALKADDTLNISYDLKIDGDQFNTKSVVALEGGANNSEVIQLGENYNNAGDVHVGTEYGVETATASQGNIARDKWVTVNITLKNSLTSISVDGTSVCENIAPPVGYTFNQAGVNKIRFMADGIDNGTGKNVYIDNVKVTVESEASEPEKPTDPVDPTGSVLLNENFDRYEIGQTANDTFCKDDANWGKLFSENTSTIVAGETGHGNALELKNEDWPNNINFEYKNMTISKQYAVIDTMFKGKASCNFDIQILNGESYKNLVNVNDLKITGDGTQLSEAWYELYAVVDTIAGTVDWAVKDMSGTAVAVGKLADIGDVKNFTSFQIQSYKAAVPLYFDEISVTQTDSKPALPKLPPKTTIFEENFNDYAVGNLFKDVKKGVWEMFYSDDSVIAQGADQYGNAMQMKPYSGDMGSIDNINWKYRNIVPELNVIDFSIMFKAATATNFDIKMLCGTEGNLNIVNINELKVSGTSDVISADTWYKLNAEINRKTEKVDYAITDLNGTEVCKASTTVSGAADFCGFGMYSYKVNGAYNDLYFDEIKVSQKCGTPALTADGLAFYKGNNSQTDLGAISTVTDKIVLTFSTVMNAQSLNENVTITVDGEPPVAYMGELSDNVFTIKLSDTLKPNTVYQINIGAGVKAYTGETIAKAVTESFKTEAGEMYGEFTSVQCDGQPLTSVTQIAAGKTVTVTANYKNSTGKALEGYIITAYYNGNEFLDSQYTAVSRGADVVNDTITINTAVPAISGATQMKVFFWDGLDTMIPVSEAYEIN